jgi:zinc/manganese transport system substrate-binding protein
MAACGGEGSAQSGKLQVVAVESFWASIAAQVGGEHVAVRAIISSPDADPHDYEPTTRDARALAGANYAIVNGAGYDPWAGKLLRANPVSGRGVLTVAELAGRKEGDDPHMWYSPSIVMKVIDQVAADLAGLDPVNASYYQRQASGLKADGFAAYNAAREAIRQRHAGTAIGSTETIFDDMAADLGLTILTPAAFRRAISEGEDVSPRDKKTFEEQIDARQIAALVYNRQNAPPDVKSLLAKARAAGIPVVEITETLDPAGASFQDWQTSQLAKLAAALQGAAAR